MDDLEAAAELERAEEWRRREAARARHRQVVAPRQLAGDPAARRELEAKYAARLPTADNILTPDAGGGPVGDNPRELEAGGGRP